MDKFSHSPFQGIVPPHILKNIVLCGNKHQKQCALESLVVTERFRGRRELISILVQSANGDGKSRTIYDAENGTDLPGSLVRSEGNKASKDAAVNEAYDASGLVYDFYKQVYGRSSIDDKGLPIDSTVHYQQRYDNAFWNGTQMVYGDGDGEIFNRFTISIDVIGHELTHGVTQYEAGLNYQGQPGALNESFSDVFGSLVKQWSLKQTVKKADWIIGQGIFTSRVDGVGLRSMKDPGTAYDDKVLGKDPQPAHMDDYVKIQSDNGGVHINSGIPNRAFYLTAEKLGGYAWEKAGKIWYVALRDKLRSKNNFKSTAETLVQVASELYGQTSDETQAVKEAWREVGVL